VLDRQPTLTGPRLLLRPLTEDDWQMLYAVASDPLIWEQHPQRNRYELEVFRAFFDEALASGGALVAIDRANGLIVGSSRFHGYDEAASEVEIGWTFLSRLYWGGVYNGEMKRLMLEHAFQAVDSVIFVIGPTNLRSQRAVAKLGAVLTEDAPPRDSGDDRVVFRLTKAAFRAKIGSPE
jgi:N-acetyltransferase